VLGGNVDDYLSLGYFSGYNASLDPYCIFLVDKPRKIVWNSFFAFFFYSSIGFCFVKESTNFLCCDYFHALLLPCLETLC